MVSIAFISDIHLEYNHPEKNLKQVTFPKADILVCAGDLGSPSSKYYRDFIAYVSSIYKHVIVIAGNHEYHACSPWRTNPMTMAQTNTKIQQICQNYGAHALNRSYVDLEGIRFYGCTLWSDPMETQGEKYWNSRSDKRHIKEFVTVKDYRKVHKKDQKWLEKVLGEKTFKGKKVVVTHHLPSTKLIEPTYIQPNPNKNGYYASHCDHLLEKCDLWICGHTHYSFDQKINGTRCVCNPVGYPWEKSPYKPLKVLKVG